MPNSIWVRGPLWHHLLEPKCHLDLASYVVPCHASGYDEATLKGGRQQRRYVLQSI